MLGPRCGAAVDRGAVGAICVSGDGGIWHMDEEEAEIYGSGDEVECVMDDVDGRPTELRSASQNRELQASADRSECVPSMPCVRRRFVHPLVRFRTDVSFWSSEESSVGSLSHMARLNLGLPLDSWFRACWRALMSLDHSVVRLAIRNRRRLYLLMRSLRDEMPPTAEGESCESPSFGCYLVPELGLTLGQLSVFHILHARTQHAQAPPEEENQ
jgi:hypothetical protein